MALKGGKKKDAQEKNKERGQKLLPYDYILSLNTAVVGGWCVKNIYIFFKSAEKALEPPLFYIPHPRAFFERAYDEPAAQKQGRNCLIERL